LAKEQEHGNFLACTGTLLENGIHPEEIQNMVRLALIILKIQTTA
jgi:hypothetical protein